MFTNTFNSLKSTFKKGVDFVKSVTLGTITAVKNDICEELEIRKEVKAIRQAKSSTSNSAKSE